MEPLRVVIDARLKDGLSGGVQQWVIGLASGLSKLQGDDEYLFLVEEDEGQWLLPYLSGGCRLLTRAKAVGGGQISNRPARASLRSRLGASFPRMHRVWQRLRRRANARYVSLSDGTVERIAPDVVHFPTQAAFLTEIPTIYQPWDLQHVHLPEFFSPDEVAKRHFTYRRFSRAAALVIAPTTSAKHDFVEEFRLDPSRIVVVNVPPATLAYSNASSVEMDAVAQRLGLPERFVYYPAQTWPHKNHSRLIQAIAQLHASGLAVPLICTGHRTDLYAELLDEAADLGIGDLVTFLGFVSALEVQAVYHRARMLVFPSLYEGWGLPVLEAFEAGVPVACSNVTPLADLAHDAAILFNPKNPAEIAEAIRRLWIDDAIAADLIKRGHAVANGFDWSNTARIMRAHYGLVAGRPPNPDDENLLAATPVV